MYKGLFTAASTAQNEESALIESNNVKYYSLKYPKRFGVNSVAVGLFEKIIR